MWYCRPAAAALTHCMPLVSFYSPWKQITYVFRMLSGGIERDQWHEIDSKYIELSKRWKKWIAWTPSSQSPVLQKITLLRNQFFSFWYPIKEHKYYTNLQLSIAGFLKYMTFYWTSGAKGLSPKPFHATLPSIKNVIKASVNHFY